MQPACPRCGRVPPPGSGPFCPTCGRYLAPLRWVAEPPPGPPPAPARPRFPYTGPPRYPAVPRWGFPLGPWRGSEPAADPAESLRAPLQILYWLLWTTFGAALVAAVAESWRYGLLLRSRSDALPAWSVAASDQLVAFGGWAMVAGELASGVALIGWTLRAVRAAAARSGTVPRSPRAVVLGWVVPLLNLARPGTVLAEIEHLALDRPAAERPRPSRLLCCWWALWVANVLFSALVFGWSFRSGVQAMADGVVLHALLDLLAAATALVTLRLVERLTALLLPPRVVPRELVVEVRPAADVPRLGDRLARLAGRLVPARAGSAGAQPRPAG